jgi:hypothetical protein
MFVRLAAAALFTSLATIASAQALTLPGCKVTDYGNGIYYLSCHEVGPALSRLRELNPQANIVATSSSFAAGSFGLGTTGYYVILNPPAAK